MKKEHIKKNNSVKENDILYNTKPLGIGILSTALKRGLLNEKHYQLLLQQTTTLNLIGEKLGALATDRSRRKFQPRLSRQPVWPRRGLQLLP